MKLEIEVDNDQSFLTVDETAVKNVVKKMFHDEGILNGRMEIDIIDDERIHEINREFLQHDYETDVLAFEMDSNPKKKLLEGNVLVSAQTALIRAPEYGWEPEKELMLYIIHGTLHLLGYDDHTPEDEPFMRQKEKEYLAFLGIDSPKKPETNEK